MKILLDDDKRYTVIYELVYQKNDFASTTTQAAQLSDPQCITGLQPLKQLLNTSLTASMTR